VLIGIVAAQLNNFIKLLFTADYSRKLFSSSEKLNPNLAYSNLMFCSASSRGRLFGQFAEFSTVALQISCSLAGRSIALIESQRA
jgi:hypothetical protein